MNDAFADHVTVLCAQDGKRLAKRFEIATNGTVIKREYDGATWFTAESEAVSGIHDLHALLCRIEGNPAACIIRGEPVAAADTTRCRRKKTGADPPFTETPRRWMMLDVDGIPLPAGVSVLADPISAGRALCDMLAAAAPELDGVSAVVQFSSSAGLDELAEAEALVDLPSRWHGVAKRGVAAHVWYWLQEPVGDAGLKRWMAKVAASGLKLDPCISRTVQVHYTAAPTFCAPLHDPLTDRRTLLITGWQDAAELQTPASLPHPPYADGDGTGGAYQGHSYEGHLTAIGGPDGFRAPILRAARDYIFSAGSDPDIGALKADLRTHIERADPGSRPPETITLYMSDPHLDAIIAWVREMNQDRLAAQKTQAAEPVAPTFPDRGVILPEADRRAAHAIEDFAAKIRLGERPELLLRITVGAGKSEAAIRGLPDLISAARTAGRDGALYYFVPRHDLGDELLSRVRSAHPGLSVAIWRGMDQPDRDAPADDPMRTMCADRELSAAAMAASQSATAACRTCRWFATRGQPLDNACAYIKQQRQRPEVWLMPHNLMFQHRPQGLPDAAVVVVDEAFIGAGLNGTDALHPVQMPLGALDDTRTGSLTGDDRERLLYLRRLANVAISAHDSDGGLHRDAFLNAGFQVFPAGSLTPDTAAEWYQLEWAAKPDPKIPPGISREATLDIFKKAQAEGFTKLRPLLAKFVMNLLRSTDARSVNVELIHDSEIGRHGAHGPAVRFAWREDFASWVATAPKLFLDATTRVEVVRCWAPDIQEVEIEVKAPGQHVRQIIGGEFGRSYFTQHKSNVRKLADLVVVELAQTRGEVLVIVQQAVEPLLLDNLCDRFGAVPERLQVAHHGDITGIDAWRDVARLTVVGRPATDRVAGERLAEILRGEAAETVSDGDVTRWPLANAGIRLADGTGRAIQQPRHPDPLVEATRWSITEAAVVQGIGRCRGVRRDPNTPVHVTVLAELALPIDVNEVSTWDDAAPGRLAVAIAEAALTGRALPLAPADLHLARPDLFSSEAAAAHVIKREKGGQTPIKKDMVPYRGMAPLLDQRTVQYRKVGGRGSLATALVPVEGGRAALEAVVGPLSAYEPMTLPVQPAEPSDLHADIEPAALFPAGTLGAEPPDILLRLPSGAHLGILPPPSRGPSMPMAHGLRVASDGRWARLPERLPARVIVAA